MKSRKRRVFFCWRNKDLRSLKKKRQGSWSSIFCTPLQLLIHINEHFCWDVSPYIFKINLPSNLLPPTACSECIFAVTFPLTSLDSKLNKEVQLFLVMTRTQRTMKNNAQRTMKKSAQYSEYTSNMIASCKVTELCMWLKYYSRI